MPRKPTSKKRSRRTAVRGVQRRPRLSPPRAAPRRSKVQSLLVPLAWKTASPQHRTAAVPGGIYITLTFDSCVTWSAEWRPTGGKVTPLAYRQPLSEAEKACEHHRRLVDANNRLIADGHEELADKDVTGAPVAWKRGRR